MKKVIYITLLVLIAVACGEQDIAQYDAYGDEALVQFETNSTLVSVGTGNQKTVEIPISISTYSSEERTVTVTVNPNPVGVINPALTENYSFNGTVTIPANELKGSFSFTGINPSGLSETVQLQLIISASSISEATLSPAIHTVNIAPEPVLWTGPSITFVYEGDGDATLPENQDRMTDLVWIARNAKWPIFNAARETQFVFHSSTYAQSLSPVGTEWAVGSISDGVENLRFSTFADVVVSGYIHIRNGNAPLVVHLINEDIYVDLTFIDWHRGTGADGGLGGFSYTRSTPEN